MLTPSDQAVFFQMCNNSLTMDTSSLQDTDVRDTGLQFLGAVLEPFLKIGVTFASFQSNGTSP
jgi:hypothetical protein